MKGGSSWVGLASTGKALKEGLKPELPWLWGGKLTHCETAYGEGYVARNCRRETSRSWVPNTDSRKMQISILHITSRKWIPPAIWGSLQVADLPQLSLWWDHHPSDTRPFSLVETLRLKALPIHEPCNVINVRCLSCSTLSHNTRKQTPSRE